jgi:adenylate cyclase class 2
MKPRSAHQEIEVKLPVSTARKGRLLLRRAGFSVVRRRVFEANVVFDTKHGTLLKRGVLLRTRLAGQESTLTYKGPPVPGRHKSRREIELSLSDPDSFRQILHQLGYESTFRYEKYRTEYRKRDSQGLITLDETPIGVFLELEGSPGWIDRIARHLGFSQVLYITDSYGNLYFDFCRQNRIPPRNMVFSDRRLSAALKTKMP